MKRNSKDIMGAGRKTQTFLAGDRPTWPPLSGDDSIHYRNLLKKDLGGVIFGCKHDTMQECLSKQLFGLPHGHFTYVRNIGEGLPLFLFNYSDRKLHGIYEAASHGHMSFDAYAWTDGGSERTPYPAQVYICMKTQCQPLAENQFSKIIMDNYYAPQHFWFELDHAQTRWLIALFKPSPPMKALFSPLRKEVFPPLHKKELFTLLPITKWKPTENKNAGHASLSKTSSNGSEDWEDLAEDNVVKVDEGNLASQKKQLDPEALKNEEERVLRLLEKLVAENEHLKSRANVTQPGFNQDNVEDVQISASVNNENGEDRDKPTTPVHSHRNAEHLNPRTNFTQPEFNHDNIEDAQISMLRNIDNENGKDQDKSMPVHSHRNAELVQVVEVLKERTSQLEKQKAEQDREMDQLRNACRDAGRTIQLLNNRVKELELRINDFIPPIDDSLERSEQCFNPEDVIYLIGGYDGCSWLSSLDCFSPALDILTPLQPMSLVRGSAASVALDGILYVFGGGYESMWFNSVECYNRRNDKWTSCTSMLYERGSHAGVTSNGKIYAIGGGNGVEWFPDVEMFDPAKGRWINIRSMSYKRFAPAAAEINGVVYAVGGFDGDNCLRSVERYDPREGTWAEIASLNVSRGSHSVAVLNEKLYCMGGYDSEKMVSSLEIFDPRLNYWEMGESLETERGYATATTLGDSVIVIGGTRKEEMVDEVECYRERTGWVTKNWRAIGERCFCSAVVI